MKHILIAVLLSAGVLEVQAQTFTTNSYSTTSATDIPDANPVGTSETFNVSGLAGTIANVQVQLDITGGFNGDLYAYLVSPQGQMAVLLNRVGLSASNPMGYGDAGFDITLDQNAANGNIHYYQTMLNPGGGQLTGGWAPDGRNIDPQSSGSAFDNASLSAGLDVFNGLDGGSANGTWTLFIADVSVGGGIATLNHAAVSIMTVPEPRAVSLAAVSGVLILLAAQKKRFNR
jgi:subtilisin-like proprotein convertase family protein